MENNLICYCGHECSKCVTYVATQKNDDSLRNQARVFYKKQFGRDIPLAKFNCSGGRSGNLFELCRECPFVKCCNERRIESCDLCVEYPCKMLKEYQDKYVNKCNQIG